MEYNNLQVNYDGTIYQYSKDPLEGYEKHTNTKGTVSYRKYYNKGVTGVLTAIEKKAGPDFRNNAEEVNLTLTDGEQRYILNFPVLDQQGDSLDEFTQSLATVLPKMQIGETYSINNWYLKKGETINGDVVKHSKKGITLKNAQGEKIKTDVTFEYIKGRGTAEEKHVKGDVPMLQWKELAGKNRPTAASKEAQLEFLYGLLSKEINRLGSQDAPTPSQQATAVAQTENPPATKQEVEVDNLPF